MDSKRKYTLTLFHLLIICFFMTCWDVNAQHSGLKFEHITSEHGLPQSTIHGIVKDKYGFMWFGTWGGLCRYDGYSFKIYKYDAGNKNSINSNRIHNIMKDDDQNIWVLTFLRDTLCRYNYEKDNFDRIPADKLSSKFITLLGRGHHVRTVNFSNKGYNWRIDHGLLLQTDLKSKARKYYRSNASDIWALNTANVSDIYLDDQGVFWVGTYSYGINKANLNAKPFDYYYHNPFTAQSLINNNVTAICEDKGANLWVGTRDHGITIISKNGRYRQVTQYSNSINDNQIRAIFCDSRGVIWIGSKTGLNSYNPDTGQFRDFSQFGLSHTNVYSITEDVEKNIWIGSWRGLYRYSPKSDRVIPWKLDFLENVGITALLQDKHEQIWIGTEGGGIYILKPNLEVDSFNMVRHLTHSNHRGLNDNRIYSMIEDSSGLVWIGTGNGLNIYDAKKGELSRLPSGNDLENATIAGIVEDDRGRIWVSHKRGLSCLDRKGFDVQTFTKEDGLQSNEFANGAIGKSSFDNVVFVGGNYGVNIFNADSISTDNTLPITVLTDIAVSNHKLEIGQKLNNRIILEKPLYLTDKIALRYNERNISIEFAGLHYSNPKGNKYAYRLIGFEDDWVYTDADRRVATYSNLRPGNYSFEVISSNSDGVWNNRPAVLEIAIAPPFWLSIWAYIIYGTMLVLAFTFYHRYSTRVTQLKSKLTYESLIRKKENELYRAKIEFFTNISHEIKTPLTLIVAPLEKLLYLFKKNELVHKQLFVMKSSGDRLLKLINQLLDFRKLEAGHVKLNLKIHDFIPFLQSIVRSFGQFAIEKKVELKFIHQVNSFHSLFDDDAVAKVISNLLSNALKHTPERGWIKVVFNTKKSGVDQNVIISVVNLGSFIVEQDLERIFLPFQSNTGNSTGGTGIGLAYVRSLVELHGGKIYAQSVEDEEKGQPITSFVVELPVGSVATGDIDVDIDVPVGDMPYDDLEKDVKINEERRRVENLSMPVEERTLVNDKIPLLLIVEDNHELRTYLVEHFENFYNIIEAENGVKGFELTSRELPDVIISDVMMPDMDGFDFCRKVKTDMKTGHIPVILLTARGSESDKIVGVENEADDYVVKPFNLDYLTARVKSLLVSRYKLKEKYRNEISLVSNTKIPASPDEEIRNKMLEYINANFANPDLSVDEICMAIGVSRASLYRKIKSMTGLSILEIIKEVRLKNAKDLLKTQNFNVNEVAFLVGFSDSDHFRKCFKAEFGLTPKEYKNLISQAGESES